MKKTLLGLATTAMLINNAWAVEDVAPSLEKIVNFRQYSENFASSGQPSAEQFAAIAEQGF